MSADKRRGRPKGSGIDDNGQLQRIAALLAADPDLKPTTAIRKIGVSDPSVIRRLRDKFHIARDGLMSELESAETVAQVRAEPAAVAAIAKAPTLGAAQAGETARAVPARFAQPVRRAEVAPKAVAPKANTRVAAPAKPAAATIAASVAERAVEPPTKPAIAQPVVDQAASAVAPKATKVVAQPAANVDATPKAAPKATAPAQPAKTVTNHQAAAPQYAPLYEVPMNSDVGNWMLTLCGFGISAASAAFEANVKFATQLMRLPQVAIALRQQVVMNELALAMTAPRPAKSRLN